MKGTKSKDNSGNALSTLFCVPRRLPKDKLVKASEMAREINPLNFAPIHRLAQVDAKFSPTPLKLAVMTTKYWGISGRRFSVSFLDGANSTVRRMILSHMNAWSRYANVSFAESSDRSGADIRIARLDNSGYWSYLGTDIRLIEPGEPTMNLEKFTEKTSESEFRRVVRHETGHTLGFPHEHMRRELVDQIDRQKAIKYFNDLAGWGPEEVEQQVLTPLEESSLLGTPHADYDSIMCYHIPGSITKDGKPIIGGKDIDKEDRQFAAKIYPKPKVPLVPPGAIADLTSTTVAEWRSPTELLAQYLALQQEQARTVNKLLTILSQRGGSFTAPYAAAAEPTARIDIETTLDRTIEMIREDIDETGQLEIFVDSDLEKDLNYTETNKRRLEPRIRNKFREYDPSVDPDDLAEASTVGDLADRIYSKYIPAEHRK